MSDLTLARALAASIAGHVDDCFGLMGNGNAHLIDGLLQESVRYHAVRHEAATVASADAYYRASGRLAAATATYGAGYTNTITALAEAAQARVPVLVVVGDAPTAGLRPWDVDQRAIADAVGVPTITLSADDIAGTVDTAVNRALHERRPVVLAIPYDLVSAPVVQRESAATVEAPALPSPGDAELDAAAGVLAAAQRPVVLAGGGAWLAGDGIRAELGRAADALGALTATTALGRGLFPKAEFDLGVTGGFGQEAAMAQITEADVALVVGAGLNQFTMQFGHLLGEGARIVRIDIERVAPPKSAHALEQLLLQGDALETLRRLTDRIEGLRQPSGWRERVEGLEPGGALRVRPTGLDEHPDGICPDGLLDPRAVASRIGELLPEDRHVTTDGGHFIGWANTYWPVASPERMMMVGTAYQTIGLGFGTVPGVAAAKPGTTVVLSTGDGGGLMALADIESAIRTAESCLIVVWNDAAYGAEVHLYGLMGLDQGPMGIPDADFAGVAAAFGAQSVRVQSLTDLDVLQRWRDAGARGTLLLDCRVSPSVVAPYQLEVQRVNGLDV